MALFDFFSSRRTLELDSPDPNTSIEDVEFLAVDMETTGLKPKQHQIVSIGWVPIKNNRVQLSGAQYVLIKGVDVGESATIHHLRDSDLEKGMELEEGIDKLTADLRGKAMLAHFAPIETSLFACLQKALGQRTAPRGSRCLLCSNAAAGTHEHLPARGRPAAKPCACAIWIAQLSQPQRTDRRHCVRGAIPSDGRAPPADKAQGYAENLQI